MLFSDVVVGHSACFMTETLLFLVEAKRSYHTKTYPFCNLKTCISWKIHDVLLRFSFFPFEFFSNLNSRITGPSQSLNDFLNMERA